MSEPFVPPTQQAQGYYNLSAASATIIHQVEPTKKQIGLFESDLPGFDCRFSLRLAGDAITHRAGV
jgi:hypothetical protein